MAEEDDILEGLDDAEGEDAADAVTEDDAAALEEAVSAAGEGDSDEELDPLAEEMLKMMEEEGDETDDSGEDVDQMMEMEMMKAMEEEGGAVPGAGPAAAAGGGLPANIERLMDVNLTVTIELGRTRKTIEAVMEYGDQSLIELDKTVGEFVDVLVNGELFARGEVVTVSENFGVRITELVNPVAHIV
ncbi:FliM/FliN family flagellar motor switch protein [Candidatus Latescibacterota bacterium]